MTMLLIIVGAAFFVYLTVAVIVYACMVSGNGELNALQRSLVPLVALVAFLWPFALVWFVYAWVRDHLPWR